MKAAIKYYLVKICRLILSIGRIFPVQKNVILLNSFNGDQYSDSPKYLCEYMKKERPGKYKYVWAVKQPKQFKELESEDMFFIRMNSVRFYWYAFTAEIIIINDGWPAILPNTRKNRMLINTWHGFNYKRQGQSKKDTNKYKLKHARLRMSSVSVWLSPAQFFTDTFLKNKTGKVLESGLPRNDILFQENSELKKQVKRRLGVEDKKIILYAPTYRPNNILPDMSVNFQEILQTVSETFPKEEWTIVLRLHRLLITQYSDFIKSYGYIDASTYVDMQELMIASDILITDYSSVAWDFSLTGKPVFLLVEDYQTYRKDPGVWIEYENLPFPYAEDTETLCHIIRKFNQKKYTEDIKKYHSDMGCADTGEACKKVLKIIENSLDKRG